MTTETPITEPVPPVDPAVAAAAAAAANAPAEPPAPNDPPAPEPAPPAAAADPAAVERQHGNKGAKPWFLQRIAEEAEGRRQAETRASELQAMVDRQSRSPADPAAPPAPPRADDTTVETRARQIAQDSINGDKIRSVISAGVAKFPDWEQRAATLGAAGAATLDFVLDVVSVDPANAHEILHQLADDPERAAHLAKMDPRTRTIELVKMSLAAQGAAAPKPAEPAKPAVPPKSVSKAPAPPPPVEPGASQAVDWRSDKATDADFSKGWDERQRERASRGRR